MPAEHVDHVGVGREQCCGGVDVVRVPRCRLLLLQSSDFCFIRWAGGHQCYSDAGTYQPGPQRALHHRAPVHKKRALKSDVSMSAMDRKRAATLVGTRTLE